MSTTLDPATCLRALRARDHRFDGRFIVGVRTTGIYCRPICPAPPAKNENLHFYPSAAAAAAAGLRPCLRCRPELAPGDGSWEVAAVTIARALRVVEALPEAGPAAIALAVGVGERHLRRLFRERLGASVVEVVQTRRLHRAKRLLDETELAISEVAWTAGYTSLRRFNEAVRAAWGTTPSALRAARRRKGVAGAPLELRLALRPPFDWDGLLGFLGARAIAGVEIVDQVSWARSFAIVPRGGTAPVTGWLRVRREGETLCLATEVANARVLPELIRRVRRVFDLDADPAVVAARLGGEPELAASFLESPGLRLPGAWDGFEVAVRAVLGQQISVVAARTLAQRLVVALGGSVAGAPEGLARLFPTAEAVASATDLVGLGILASRARTLRALAQAVVDGRLELEVGADPERRRAVLLAIPGIGAWTADVIALRLGDPDAFPSADLGLLRAMDPTRTASAATLAGRAEAWRPFRAYAAIHLWRRDSLALTRKEPLACDTE